ncbi:hypothetical protein PTSG_04426 [Salpingoeca rosetta]|uniref:ubiquitinyl hydrolase 1 n=1 Tax=Salpingoeca rosetta (strain ATCC 50818 / BSB-021) TaxID=946362 RepID=F2U8I9_SALR5|nr:uncharacterized protein PTSG_04426 [Salpingoeca rosetta]EGD72697.1 hypothetical protein PTSG_04426 [Salpingoeca rosetta]|eukprot:XP_004994520.1 hypothetical protein PTSG_04426 [Salpingoeca rosetta]
MKCESFEQLRDKAEQSIDKLFDDKGVARFFAHAQKLAELGKKEKDDEMALFHFYRAIYLLTRIQQSKTYKAKKDALGPQMAKAMPVFDMAASNVERLKKIVKDKYAQEAEKRARARAKQEQPNMSAEEEAFLDMFPSVPDEHIVDGVSTGRLSHSHDEIHQWVHGRPMDTTAPDADTVASNDVFSDGAALPPAPPPASQSPSTPPTTSPSSILQPTHSHPTTPASNPPLHPMQPTPSSAPTAPSASTANAASGQGGDSNFLVDLGWPPSSSTQPPPPQQPSPSSSSSAATGAHQPLISLDNGGDAGDGGASAPEHRPQPPASSQSPASPLHSPAASTTLIPLSPTADQATTAAVTDGSAASDMLDATTTNGGGRDGSGSGSAGALFVSPEEFHAIMNTCLVVDLRSHSRFRMAAISPLLTSVDCVNIPGEDMREGMSADDVRSLVRNHGSVRAFDRRNSYKRIVLVTEGDEDSRRTDTGPIKWFTDALVHYGGAEELTVPMCVLKGGYREHYHMYPSDCSGAPLDTVRQSPRTRNPVSFDVPSIPEPKAKQRPKPTTAASAAATAAVTASRGAQQSLPSAHTHGDLSRNVGAAAVDDTTRAGNGDEDVLESPYRLHRQVLQAHQEEEERRERKRREEEEERRRRMQAEEEERKMRKQREQEEEEEERRRRRRKQAAEEERIRKQQQQMEEAERKRRMMMEEEEVEDRRRRAGVLPGTSDGDAVRPGLPARSLSSTAAVAWPQTPAQQQLPALPSASPPPLARTVGAEGVPAAGPLPPAPHAPPAPHVARMAASEGAVRDVGAEGVDDSSAGKRKPTRPPPAPPAGRVLTKPSTPQQPQRVDKNKGGGDGGHARVQPDALPALRPAARAIEQDDVNCDDGGTSGSGGDDHAPSSPPSSSSPLPPPYSDAVTAKYDLPARDVGAVGLDHAGGDGTTVTPSAPSTLRSTAPAPQTAGSHPTHATTTQQQQKQERAALEAKAKLRMENGKVVYPPKVPDAPKPVVDATPPRTVGASGMDTSDSSGSGGHSSNSDHSRSSSDGGAPSLRAGRRGRVKPYTAISAVQASRNANKPPARAPPTPPVVHVSTTGPHSSRSSSSTSSVSSGDSANGVNDASTDGDSHRDRYLRSFQNRTNNAHSNSNGSRNGSGGRVAPPNKPPPKPLSYAPPHARARARARTTDDLPRRSAATLDNGSMTAGGGVRKPLVDRSTKPRAALSVGRCRPELTVPRMQSMRLIQSSYPISTGLKNLGNTCYMNAVLQCLAHTKQLATYFVQKRYRNHLNRRSKFGCKGEVAEELAELLTVLTSRQYRHLSPSMFKEVFASYCPQFAGYDQQDCQEFASMLLDKLHEDLNRVVAKPPAKDLDLSGMDAVRAGNEAWKQCIARDNSIITDLFQGQFRSVTRCNTCRYESATYSPFTSLSLPVPPHGRYSLHHCIRLFSRQENMTGNNQWKCPKCKAYRDAIKFMGIWRLPRCLLIHLKRFYFNGPFRDKINTMIDFPQNLQLGKDDVMSFSRPEQRENYSLYAVANHYGTLTGGHYIAFAKHAGRWEKYDDSVVSPMAPQQVVTPAAYVLFYSSLDL